MAGQEYSVNLGLDALPITTDQNNLPDMIRLYNATKGLAIALDSATGAISKPVGDWSTVGINFLRLQNMCRFYCYFTETVAAGNIVTIYNNSGNPAAKKAGGVNLAAGLAQGFVLAPVTAGNYGEIFLKGVNNMITGMTPGAYYDLSTATAGLITASATTPYKQTLGFALTSTALWFDPDKYAR